MDYDFCTDLNRTWQQNMAGGLYETKRRGSWALTSTADFTALQSQIVMDHAAAEQLLL